MNFVALDFETANERGDSAISIGLAIVSDGKLVASHHHLIRPPEMRFEFYQSEKHGLCEADVASSPTFAELWATIQPLIEGKLVVAHNASFDLKVVRESCCTYSIEVPKISYLCSYSLAQRAWPGLSSYKLPELAAHFSLGLTPHHAESDARAVASLVLLAASEYGYTCPFQLAEFLGMRIGEIFSHDDWIPCSSPRTSSRAMSKNKSGGPPSDKAFRILRSKSQLTEVEIAELSEAEAWKLIYTINPPKTSPTKGNHETCFTGFSDAEKVRLQQLATASGLSVVKTVTKTLMFLVAGENAGPSKLQKAIDQEAIILNEEEFMRFLDDGTTPTEGI